MEEAEQKRKGRGRQNSGMEEVEQKRKEEDDRIVGWRKQNRREKEEDDRMRRRNCKTERRKFVIRKQCGE